MNYDKEHANALRVCDSARTEEGRKAFNACDDRFRAYAHVVDNTIYIAPTTGCVSDWLINFIVYPILQLPLAMTMHAGFASIAKALYPKVTRRLNKKEPVSVFGYSQGAAVAHILSHWLSLKGYKVAEVITFASPYPYGWLYRLMKRLHPVGVSLNYVTRGDLIAHMPPWMTRTGTTIRLGGWKDWRPVWIAHRPDTYLRHLENSK
ncbi:MAG: hypothetical protein LC687_04175 [Actinobacteria bacterium]|nr:hypothetical protein [Actinomycetota bacterium]MCA1807032.1 hypothetical protein [Actinomycetota bacterium]